MLGARPASVLLAFALATSAGCQGKGKSPLSDAEDGPSVAVEFSGKTTRGKDLDLADYRDKVVLVNVWASWCAPCRKELPELQELHHAHGPDFAVVGISTDKPNNHRNVNALMAQFGIDYPVILDPDGAAAGVFGVNGYPTSVLLDRNGVVRWRRQGIILPNDSEADAAIKAALQAG